jgi:hypothetical protein
MNTIRQAIIAISLSVFCSSGGYGQENPCVENPRGMKCLSLKNPQSLAGDCARDERSRSCVCAQSCGVSTLATHAEALKHLGYASCYKTGVISPFTGCLGLTNVPLNSLDAWVSVGDGLLR